MNLLFYGPWGGSLSIISRLTKEGHKCRLFMDGTNIGDQAKGLCDIVKDPKESYEWSDLIVFDDGGDGQKAQELRKQGFLVWGSTPLCDKLESDRSFGQEAMKKAGIPIAPFHEFKTLEEAIAFVKAHPGKCYAAKMDGKAIADEKMTSYVGKLEDGSDLIEMLEQFKRYGNKIETVNLQDCVRGVEVGVAGHFNGHDFVEPIEVSFEHKKLLDGNKGPSTGEMGTTGLFVSKDSKFYLNTIGKMKSFLEKEHYVGYFCIGCIADSKQLWPLEMTTRFGYPTINLYLENVKENFGQMLFDIASGQDGKVSMKNPYVSCLVVALPPYPFHSPDVGQKYCTDMPVFMKTANYDGIWPTQIYKDGTKWRCAGIDGYNVVVTGSGQSMRETLAQMYARKDNLFIPNEMYRSDIGKTFDDDMKQLKEWKYL